MNGICITEMKKQTNIKRIELKIEIIWTRIGRVIK